MTTTISSSVQDPNRNIHLLVRFKGMPKGRLVGIFPPQKHLILLSDRIGKDLNNLTKTSEMKISLQSIVELSFLAILFSSQIYSKHTPFWVS
jgi:hypothetical protein